MKKSASFNSIWIILFLLFASCTFDTELRGVQLNYGKELPQHLRYEVPYIPQNDTYSCGTTSLSMAISYYLGRSEDPLDKDEAWEISQTDIDFTHKFGFDLKSFKRLVEHFNCRGEMVNELGLDRLKRVLAEGYLVVLFIQPDPENASTHAILAVGYNEQQEIIFIKDPSTNQKYIWNPHLLERWKAWIGKPAGMSQQAGYIIYPPEI
jgi:hypothetical protein